MSDPGGDVLCPTCHRWTPPAPFCTECGAALQGRSEESGGTADSDVFRRGRPVDEPGAPWTGGERFEPEPEDAAARAAAAAAGAGGAQRIDRLAEPQRPAEPDTRPPPAAAPPSSEPPTAVPPPPAQESAKQQQKAAAAAAAGAGLAAAQATPPPSPAGPPQPPSTQAAPPPPPAQTTPPPPPAQAAPPPTPPPTSAAPPPAAPPSAPPTVAMGGPSQPDRDGGVSGLVFVLFLGLGVIALLGGAILGGVFDGEPTGEASPTAVVATPTPEPTPEPTVGPSGEPTATPGAPTPVPSNPEPTTFPDGFIARAEVCAEQPTSETCDNSGAVNDGELWILVSFRHAKPDDVIGVAIVDSFGNIEADASLDLSFCGQNTDCAGYTYFRFGNLDPGAYDVRASRNGTLAAETSFTVE